MLGRLSIGVRPALRASQLMFAPRARMLSGFKTDKVSAEQGYEILVNQRKNRPLSPDLTIYKPQITMVLSGLHRITGVALGGVFYAYCIGYAALPALGFTFLAPAAVAASFGALPFIAKFGIKFLAALPFSFHSFNGIRHLAWDTVKGLTIPQVYKSGYLVVGLTLLSSVLLAII